MNPGGEQLALKCACLVQACVWYCGSFCDCDLKKISLEKKTLLVVNDLIKICVWLKPWLKFLSGKKQVQCA